MTSNANTLLITDFAVAEYNKKITRNKIASILVTLDTFKDFSFVCNEEFLFMINTPYKKRKVNGADYGNDYPYEEIYKNAYLITKDMGELEDSDDERDLCGCKDCKLFEDKPIPKCIYNVTCGNDADYKTMDGKIDGRRSSDWGNLGYGNNHLYHWNLCGVCHKAECGEDTDTDTDNDDGVCCVACEVVVCNKADDPPYKDERDEAVCENCWVELGYDNECNDNCDTWGEGTPKCVE